MYSPSIQRPFPRLQVDLASYMMFTANKMAAPTTNPMAWNIQQQHHAQQLQRMQQYSIPTSTPTMSSPSPAQNNFPTDIFQQMGYNGPSNMISSSEALLTSPSYPQMYQARSQSQDMSDFTFGSNYQTPTTPMSTFGDLNLQNEELMSNYSDASFLSSEGFDIDSLMQNSRSAVASPQPMSNYMSSSAPQLQMPFHHQQQQQQQQRHRHRLSVQLYPTQMDSHNPPPPTEVDHLMYSLNKSSQPSTPSSAVMSTPVSPMGGMKPKRNVCSEPGCNKAFSQPTHLKIHMRSHTGEKPYRCSVSCCGASFSQLGNLRTHERRHRGEKPRRRPRSGSDASQHSGSAPMGSESKRYECRLDECRKFQNEEDGTTGKVFTQLGNLKAHMNKFHKETLNKLSNQFRLEAEGYVPSYDQRKDGNVAGMMGLGLSNDEEEELKQYFRGLFRNCNKGIKGRGKGRRVTVMV